VARPGPSEHALQLFTAHLPAFLASERKSLLLYLGAMGYRGFGGSEREEGMALGNKNCWTAG
jgi:hypothetical protein